MIIAFALCPGMCIWFAHDSYSVSDIIHASLYNPHKIHILFFPIISLGYDVFDLNEMHDKKNVKKTCRNRWKLNTQKKYFLK
jgi:hypothetical protein